MNTLASLRHIIQQAGVHGFIQPVHDEYMSEYPPACNQRVEFLTGFTGSAGMAVVLADKAAMFSDGRYTLQLAQQVDSKQFELLDSGQVTPEKWLADTMQPGQVLGYDAKLTSASALKRLTAALGKRDVTLKAISNPVDSIWSERPAPPASHLFVHGLEFAGEDSMKKRTAIAQRIKDEGALACILTAPESVCWLLNVRGGDVENTPVALITAIIDKEGGVRLYIGPWRVSEEVKTHLGAGVKVREPIQLESDIRTLASDGARIMLDSSSAPVWFQQIVEDTGGVVVEVTDPCTMPKACKNMTELAGIRAAHLRDGVAIAKLLCWLDAQNGVDEIAVADKLLALRKEQNLFSEPSFPTIAGSGPNGAIVHYRATNESNRTLKKGELFLLDSGGQYRDGTTDITRTVAIGEPSAEQKDRFTRVLKGHIAIATATFPEGTSGSQLDSLARHALWEVGLDYDHGTGHGVGQFLGVHEGPQRISKRGGDVALKQGMILSNEPGYYKTGEYGIRIENLVAVREAKEGESKKFLQFESLTCAPIDHRLVDAALLTPQEKTWFNNYHAWVAEQLSPALSADERRWLAAACAPIN